MQKNKKNNIKNKIKNKNFLKGIFSLIGCLIHSFVNSIFYSFSYLTIYLLSYLKTFNNEINIRNYYIFSPIVTIFYGISSPISGVLNKKIGITKTLFLGNFLMILPSYLIYLSENIYFDYFVFIFYGIGIGLSQRITIHNSVQYFPGCKGLISSLYSTFCGIGIIFLNFYVENFIINPKHFEPNVENNTFYSGEINCNFKKFLKLQIFCYLILTFLTFVFIFPFENEKNFYDENFENFDDEKNYVQMEKDDENEYDINEIKMVLKSKRFLKILIIFFNTIFFVTLIENTFRPIAILKKIDTKTQQNIISIVFILICVLTLIFGILFDKFSFRILMNMINFIICFSCFFYNFCDYSNISFVFWCLSISFGNAGIYSILYPHIMKIFGIKYYLELSGIVSLMDSLSSPFVSVFVFYMDFFFENNRNFGYFLVYFFCGILNIFSIFFSCYENEIEFDYKK